MFSKLEYRVRVPQRQKRRSRAITSQIVFRPNFERDASRAMARVKSSVQPSLVNAKSCCAVYCFYLGGRALLSLRLLHLRLHRTEYGPAALLRQSLGCTVNPKSAVDHPGLSPEDLCHYIGHCQTASPATGVCERYPMRKGKCDS